MLGLRRPYDLIVAFACGGALTLLALRNPPAVSTEDLGVVMPVVPAASPIPADLGVIEEPLPQAERDSIAAMLISSPIAARSAGRGESETLLAIVLGAARMRNPSDVIESLEEIVGLDGLDATVVTAIARALERLPTSSSRERVLRTLIRRHSHATGVSRSAVLAAIAATRNSSSDRAATLELFVTHRGIGEPGLVDAMTHIARLPADGDRARVLVAAARANRIQGRARSAYMKAANGIASIRDRQRALAAIGEKIGADQGRM